MTDLAMLRAQAKEQAKRERREWRNIEDAAQEQVRAELKAAETAPLTVGSFVAWARSTGDGWQTDALSVLHRAGATIGDQAVTFCGEVIPAPVRRLPLGPGLIQTLDRCRWCEEKAARPGVFAA